MENSQIEKTIGEQVADLLKRKPENHDVTFSVGPDKIQIGAVRILLKAVSPVFEKEFEENWESAVVKEGEGIPLLDVDPVVFQIFVKLIIADTWSLDTLKKLNLAPDTLLSLLGLCRRFKITKAIKNLEAAVEDFVQAFYKFKEDERAKYDTTQLSLKTNPRNSFEFSVLRLSDHLKFTTDPLFVCNGSYVEFCFQVNQKITLHGVGFLGPVDGDTQYDATLQIRRAFNGEWAFASSTFENQIVARKDRIFQFLLDKPITIEPNAFDSSWKKCYWIQYSLKGTNNVPQYKGKWAAKTSMQISGVQFNLKYFSGKPFTELLYKMQ